MYGLNCISTVCQLKFPVELQLCNYIWVLLMSVAQQNPSWQNIFSNVLKPDKLVGAFQKIYLGIFSYYRMNIVEPWGICKYREFWEIKQNMNLGYLGTENFWGVGVLNKPVNFRLWCLKYFKVFKTWRMMNLICNVACLKWNFWFKILL